ncbi:hypothetical protein D3Z50_14960 [Clostridiaceae bacterium]|jgi:hypothetical protein|nr:hypothetical protein [Clostridium sp.]NBI72339.1 hypothetical protein [Clostridiaceae bacterium]
MMIKKLSWIKQFSGLPCFLILMTGYLLMQAGLIRTLQVGFIIIVFLWTEKLLREKKGSHLCEAVIFMFFFLWVIHNKLFTFFKEPYNAWIYTLFTIGLCVYIYRHGLSYNHTIWKTGGMRSLCQLILTFCFFGFQIRNVASPYRPLANLLLGSLFYWWCSVFCKTVIWMAETAAGKKSLLLRKEFDRDADKNVKLVWGLLFSAVCSVGLVMSILYYPGIISPDSMSNYRCAVEFADVSVRTDIHSFGYILLSKLLLSIHPGYYTLTISMVLGFATVWATYWAYLYKKGFRFWVVFLITVIWLSIPGNAYLLICTWKDIPFAISMLLLSYMMTRYCLEDDFCVRWRNLFLFGIALFGVSVFRSNGQIVLLFVAFALVSGWLLRKINKRMALVSLSSLILLLLFKGPVFSLLQVQQTPQGLAAVPLVDGIWENLCSGREVSDDVIKFVEEEIMPVEDFIASYREHYTNIYVFPKGYSTIDFGKAKRAYLWCLKHHPYTTLLARLKRTYNIWSVFASESYPVSINYCSEISDYSSINEAYSWKFIERFEWFRQKFAFIFRENYLIGAIQFFVSRCGWNFVLWGISAAVLMMMKRRKYLLIILPAFANMVGLLLGCCFPDSRYVYPMFLLTIPYLAVLYLVCTFSVKLND